MKMLIKRTKSSLRLQQIIALFLLLFSIACATAKHQSLYTKVVALKKAQDIKTAYANKKNIPQKLVDAWYHILVKFDPDRAEESLDALNQKFANRKEYLLARLFIAFDKGQFPDMWRAAKQIVENYPYSLESLFATAMLNRYVLPNISSSYWDEIAAWAKRTASKVDLNSLPELKVGLLRIAKYIATRKDDVLAAFELEQRLGLISQWITSEPIGYFPYYELRSYTSPMLEDDKLRSVYDTKFGKIKLFVVDELNHPIVDEKKVFNHRGLVYRAAFFKLNKPTTVFVRAEGECAAKVFINGYNIINHDPISQFRATVSGALVRLEAGIYRIETLIAYESLDVLNVFVLNTQTGTPIHTWASFSKQPNYLCKNCISGVERSFGASAMLKVVFAEASNDPVFVAMASVVKGEFYNDLHQERWRLADAMRFAPNWVSLRVLLANAYVHDPSIPYSHRKSLARREYRVAYKLSKGKSFWALVDRFQELANNSDREGAFDVLDRIKALFPISPFLLRLELSVYNNDFWADKRIALIERLVRLDPYNPDTVQELLIERERYFQFDKADKLFAKMLSLSRERMGLINRLLDKGDIAKALQIARDELKLFPADINMRQTVVHLLLLMGKFDEAEKVAKQLCNLPGGNSYCDRIKQITASMRLDEQAYEQFLMQEVRRHPENLNLRRNVLLMLGREEFEHYATDAYEVIAKYQEARKDYYAGMVNVLDEYIVEFLPNGGYVERVHMIHHLLGQEAVERMTELEPPSDTVYNLRAITPGGEVIFPHKVPGKSTVAFPHLSVGDFVEIDYVNYVAPDTKIPEFANTRFYFLSPHVPTFLSHLVVEIPENSKVKLSWKPPAEEPFASQPPKVVKAGGAVLYEWRYNNLPAYTPEPGMPPEFEVIPQVHVYYAMDWQEIAAYEWERFVKTQKRSHEIDMFAQNASKGLSGKKLVNTLYRKVCNYIKYGGALEAYPFYAYYTHSGGRLLFFKAILDFLSIPSHFVHVIPPIYKPVDEEADRIQYLTDTLLMVSVDGQKLFFDGASKYALPGVFSGLLAGGKGLVLMPPETPAEFIQIPEPSIPPQKGRFSRLVLNLSQNGELIAEGEERVKGYESRRFRSMFANTSPENWQKRIERALNSSPFRGARLLELKIENLEEPEKFFIIRYKFSVAHFAKRVQNGLMLETPFFPSRLGKRFVHTFVRYFPLLIQSPYVSNDEIIIKPPPDYRLVKAPFGRRNITEKFGLYSLEVSLQHNGTILMKRKVYIPPQRIAPEEYPQFMTFCTRVDKIEKQPWVLQRNPSQFPSTVQKNKKKTNAEAQR